MNTVSAIGACRFIWRTISWKASRRQFRAYGASPSPRRVCRPLRRCCRSSPRPKLRGQDGDGAEFEELALRLAGAVYAALAETTRRAAAPSRRDERRISRALRLIEARADEPLSLPDLACAAAMSPYHFLRTFRTVVGMTPHQFILHTRLYRAALRLRRTTEDIATIAFAVGFGDLSTFNRRFARIVGLSPSVYRALSRR